MTVNLVLAPAVLTVSPVTGDRASRPASAAILAYAPGPRVAAAQATEREQACSNA